MGNRGGISDPMVEQVVTGLDPMVEQVVLGDVLRVDGTLDDHLPSHSSSVDHLDQIQEVLLGLKTAHKLGVIWRPV